MFEVLTAAHAPDVRRTGPSRACHSDSLGGTRTSSPPSRVAPNGAAACAVSHISALRHSAPLGRARKVAPVAGFMLTREMADLGSRCRAPAHASHRYRRGWQLISARALGIARRAQRIDRHALGSIFLATGGIFGFELVALSHRADSVW
jgi:hypothetical protein